MVETLLTTDDILDAAEQVLRRFGPAKTTVVDVARALNVSHGSIYRHFASKAALRDAVAERWLHAVAAPLAAIANDCSPPAERLCRWFQGLISAKRELAQDDPELFATYHALASESRAVIEGHITELTGQIGQILRDGVADGSFAAEDPARTAIALFSATAKYHHPAHAGTWGRAGLQQDFDILWSLLMDGLRPR